MAMMRDLPLEMLTHLCQHLSLVDLVRVAATCKRFRHGGLPTVRLPTESPVITVLQRHAFVRPEPIPSTRPIGRSESWVAYLARCARQRRCREDPPMVAEQQRSLFVDAAGRLLWCGATGYGNGQLPHHLPIPVAPMAEVRVRSVVAARDHNLALGWDGRVYSWGSNDHGQLGHGDKLARPSPVLVEGLEGVRGIATDCHGDGTSPCSFAVIQSGDVFLWGKPFPPEAKDSLRPVIVEGFGGVRVLCVCPGRSHAYAISEDWEGFSWGRAAQGLLGHGDTYSQPSPKRVEALRGVRVSDVSVGWFHALALAEDGLVYAWGENLEEALLGDMYVKERELPKPIEALRGVRVTSIVVGEARSYALADTGELWAWGFDGTRECPLGHDEQVNCRLPKPIASLRGVKVDAVAAGGSHTLAMADDGRVYSWGALCAASVGALGLGPSIREAMKTARRPQRIPALRLACCL
jgi:alpha-tubulin suppressor-like RCC1 family protein